ncbi:MULTISPECIES: hypothetical protein [Bradyrhizobium]|jgi:hypothetical protein|uniref:Uncharacterized protein n=1 Tax=Bradyrhizobium elkanii TaxID=29448 RepID=A0ABV4EQG9_BRAEL|nr:MULTISPECIES: hypothetical protein [Bradyrhizobium]MCP1758734.1 hypothetical protein [Bradyrhizobium elkanii]MCP1975753.1 hypothetical protein [Bradyrhizobium elkanii]MCP1984931.1 hypothetical protein [Bradyrhizobium elkanii]MCS3453960.1 hypothetical protein [Bradyrhizobium elkanii]MCS3566993.1 hypothetical protein [Bradyrhizobium elkanii]
MHDDSKLSSAPPAAPDGGEFAERKPLLDGDRRDVRTVDLTDEDIAAIVASEMAPGFEHLNVEVEEN